MKRLLILLVVLASALAAAAFGVPTNAAQVTALGVTTSVSQNQLNSDLQAIHDSVDYQCFLDAEEAVGSNGESALPPIYGVSQSATDTSHSAINTAFADSYLNTEIGQQVAEDLAVRRHLSPTRADLTTARADLMSQITAVFQDVGEAQVCQLTQLPTASAVMHSIAPMVVNRTLKFDADVILLEESYSGFGTTTAGLERYYQEHRSNFDNACFTVAQYSTESAAAADAAKVKAGTPFSTLAAAVPGGGPQGCYILAGIASSLPAGSNVESLPTNTVSAPIAEGSAYLLIEITDRTVTPFATAKAEVAGAVQSAGATKARTSIGAELALASVSIDPRYGTWSDKASRILTPLSPLVVDTLNPAVNAQGVAATSGSAAVPATGQAG